MPEARWMGIDVTTTEMALAVSDTRQAEGFASLAMRGATRWNGDKDYPAFELTFVPGMLRELLGSLAAQGWTFASGGSLSVACRQHDMVLLGQDGQPRIPALSWQCNAAEEETKRLNRDDRVKQTVGPVEARFILPKLAHVLKKDESLKDQITSVMTTGDWILGMLAGSFRLSTSDALSNGLLDQQKRELAKEILSQEQIDPGWFPDVIQSGDRIGDVSKSAHDAGDPSATSAAAAEWAGIAEMLAGWQVVAGLGDNHASALGCGMTDEQTLVVSAGTSGTINLARTAGAPLNEVAEPAVRFEFYRERSLLLRMLAYCGDWYVRFLDEFGGDLRDAHPFLDDLAAGIELARVTRVECDRHGELYRPGWTRATLAQKVASIQYSIALELLIHVRKLLEEVPEARQQIARYVLTGGLSQSPLFQQVFRAGIELLDPFKESNVSGRTGPLRYKTSAYGALLNARMPEWEQNLENIPADVFPLDDCARASGKRSGQLESRLKEELGA